MFQILTFLCYACLTFLWILSSEDEEEIEITMRINTNLRETTRRKILHCTELKNFSVSIEIKFKLVFIITYIIKIMAILAVKIL